MTAKTGRSNPETTVQTVFGAVVQLVSTGGTAMLGESTATASESVLKTSNWVPASFAITVLALGTAIAVSAPAEKFMTSMAPRNEKPLTVAVGTAAYPVGRAVGNTMLEVGPGSRTLPNAASVVVETA